jgi:hypothetical protein
MNKTSGAHSCLDSRVFPSIFQWDNGMAINFAPLPFFFGLPERFVLIGPARFKALTDEAWRFGELKSRWSCERGAAFMERNDLRRSTRII